MPFWATIVVILYSKEYVFCIILIMLLLSAYLEATKHNKILLLINKWKSLKMKGQAI